MDVLLAMRQLVGLTLALTLSGAPAVAVVCIALCGDDRSHAADHERASHAPNPHAGHHASAAPSDLAELNRTAHEPAHHHAAETHHYHEDEAVDVSHEEVDETSWARVAGTPADCCAEHASVGTAHALVPTRSDVGSPLAAPVTLVLLPAAGVTTRLHEPRAGPPPPAAPTRSPLVLRI